MSLFEKLKYVNIYAVEVFIAFFIEWRIFALEIDYPTHNFIGTLLKFGGEVAIVIFPLYFFNGKWKRVCVCLIWIAAVLMFSNVLYYRFWGDIMGVDAIMLWGNVNSILINSMIGLTRWVDIVYIIIPLLLTYIYYRGHKKIEAAEDHVMLYKFGYLFVLLACIFLSQLTYAFAGYRYSRSMGLDSGFVDSFTRRFTTPIFKNQYEYNNLGSICFGIKSLNNVLKNHKPISIENTESIDKFINKIGQTNVTNNIVSDSIANNNSNKNLILIVVESLNSEVIGATINGNKVTPVLESLLSEEGTVSSLNMVTQVYKGGSSDGQLLINTGLLPIATEAASMSYSDRIELPSLVKKLRKDNNIAVFADDASSWKQKEVYYNFGFDSVFCSEDFKDDIEEFGSDAYMFRYGENLIAEIKDSFFIEFITISMHVPFDEAGFPRKSWLESVDMATSDRNYLNAVNYFDTELGKFLNWLKDNNLYDNSLIVIVSDHSQTVDDIYTGNIYEKGMAFIAVNTGITDKIEAKTGQVNVYPTILQLMKPDIKLDEYQGLGKSLLDTTLTGALDPEGVFYGSSGDEVDMKRAYQVSDSIIRGDYFGLKIKDR